MSEARAPKVALPARTAVGLIEVLETAMGRGEETTHKSVATQYWVGSLVRPYLILVGLRASVNISAALPEAVLLSGSRRLSSITSDTVSMSKEMRLLEIE